MLMCRDVGSFSLLCGILPCECMKLYPFFAQKIVRCLLWTGLHSSAFPVVEVGMELLGGRSCICLLSQITFLPLCEGLSVVFLYQTVVRWAVVTPASGVVFLWFVKGQHIFVHLPGPWISSFPKSTQAFYLCLVDCLEICLFFLNSILGVYILVMNLCDYKCIYLFSVCGLSPYSLFCILISI